MGDIRVKLVATRKGKTLRSAALVDNGAVTSVFGLDDACQLGLDVARAKKVHRETAGGLRLAGLRLRDVHVRAGEREAILNDVFVPVAQVITVRDPKTGRTVEKSAPVARDEEPLLGQDFLQASQSYLDFATDSLRGVEELGPPVRLHQKPVVRPATRTERELIRALATCPVTDKKKKSR